MKRATVVGESRTLTKQEFHTRMIAGLSRAAVTLGGRGALADKMDLTGEGLSKVFEGGMTNPKRLWDLLEHDETVLDDIAKAYGRRIVDKAAVCDTDDAGVQIAKLLLWLQEAQHPDSPGGRRVVGQEVLKAEALIRQLHGATGNWIDMIDELRAPSGLRSVG